MLKKDITFIYMDTAEKAAYQPILEEAEKRGYKVKLTDNKLEECEIGFYCQHQNFPQYSKFSLIMLHDIIQQYGNWPDIWFREPWNKYDVGILPSDQWEKNWQESSKWYYSNPRLGVYKIGWPKADAIANLQSETDRENFYKKHGMDPTKRTILYAPAWENDGKQDDFVRAMQKLDVNILVKQAAFNPKLFPQQVQNIKAMYELHKNISRVTILPPETNIFEAIAVSDILVSEESSTMCEAAMMGIPAISVSDWLIPDVTPSRFPMCDYDFVYMTHKSELSDFVAKILKDYDEYHTQTIDFAKKNFLNIGNTAAMIMDIIDDCVAGKQIRYSAIQGQRRQRLPLKKYFGHILHRIQIEMSENYCVKYKAAEFIWHIARLIIRGRWNPKEKSV